MRGRILAGGFFLGILPMLCFAAVQIDPSVTHTQVIGTAKQPTIEGGFIHEAEQTEEKEKTDKEKRVTQSTLIDDYPTDETLKALLTQTATQHKLAYVLARAQALHLPATVALIPLVESHYQTTAVSPKGATGAWQLMPGTARDYGLNENARENFTASTECALHLLTDLHQKFCNWTLAFAAYNAGSTRVQSALSQNPHARWINDLDLPPETQHYVHRLKTLYQSIGYLHLKNKNNDNE